MLAALLPRIPESARRYLIRALRFTYGFQISAKAVATAATTSALVDACLCSAWAWTVPPGSS